MNVKSKLFFSKTCFLVEVAILVFAHLNILKIILDSFQSFLINQFASFCNLNRVS